MNKVLITGLGIGNSMELCDACNMDYSWLVDNPATFIWADKICIPSNLFGYYSPENTKFSNALRVIMDIADDHGIVEKITVPDSYKKESEAIYLAAIKDTEQLFARFPEAVKKGTDKVPNEILIYERRFCGPFIASIYASIKLANDIGANCLFSDDVNCYLKYRYGLETNKHIHENETKIYNEIFQTLIPNEPILHDYAVVSDKKCRRCSNVGHCKDSYLSEIEKNLLAILKWREYDEVYRAKEVINDLILRKNEINSEEDIKAVILEFEAKKAEINSNINKRFPSIRRWANLVAIVASPVVVYSALSGEATLTAVSAGLMGISTTIEKATEVYKSRNNWVGFFDKKPQS